MDNRIAALLPGLSLCDIPLDTEHDTGEGAVPAAFAVLKLCLTPDATLRKPKFLGEGEHIPLLPDMLAQLPAGTAGTRAVRAGSEERRVGIECCWSGRPRGCP